MIDAAAHSVHFKEQCKQLQRFIKSILAVVEDISEADEQYVLRLKQDFVALSAALDKAHQAVSTCGAIGRVQALLQAPAILRSFANVSAGLHNALQALAEHSTDICDPITSQQLATMLQQLSAVSAQPADKEEAQLRQLRSLAESIRIEQGGKSQNAGSFAAQAQSALNGSTGTARHELHELLAALLDGCISSSSTCHCNDWQSRTNTGL